MALPSKDFPPRSTVHNYFVWWQCDRVLDRIHHARICGDLDPSLASPKMTPISIRA
jgi:hypothetical protein